MAARLNNITNHLGRTITSRQGLRRTMASSSEASLAILDDYAGIAASHFEHIKGLKVDSFPETLNAATPEGLEALAKRLQPYQVISAMRERTAILADLQKQLPNLKLIMTTGQRNASIDLKSAHELGITVTTALGARPKDTSGFIGDDLPPPPSGNFTNQHAWALLLGLCARLPQDDHAVKTDPKAWQSGFGIPLGGKTLGCAGLGKLGALMAKTAVQSFGMNVIAWSENLTQEKADKAAEDAGFAKGTFKAVSKEELFKQADVVSVHLVLSPRSRHVVGEKELAMMKKSALLVNTSRGGLIDDTAFIKVLKEGGIRGAALDVFSIEPLPEDSPYRSTDFKSQVVLSPHMGYVNGGVMNRWYQEQAQTVEKWMKGEEFKKVGLEW